MSSAPRPFVVFYAWQSDLPEKANRYLLRDALRNAAKILEKELPAAFSEVQIDEATRDLPGSPNIPAAIQQKILEADAVVCDVSTVLRSAPGAKERATPNPNVVFELGLAAANHGWARIIMLLNEEHGSVDDLPFDFDRHRVGVFRSRTLEVPTESSAGAELAETKGRASALAYHALLAIIRHQPPRPADLRGISPEQMRRRHDVDTLTDLFRTIHWPTIEDFVENAPKRYWSSILHFHARFDGFLSTGLFYLYDQRARELVEMLARAWDDALGTASNYVRAGSPNRFVWPIPGDLPFTDEQEQSAWDHAQDAVRQMAEVGHELIRHVRENYQEINLEEASAEAGQEFQEYYREPKSGE